MVFRRKQLPEDLRPVFAVFDDQVDRLEAARAALMSCLPVGRVDPAPVAIGLDLLDDVLGEIAVELPRWRHDAVAAEWEECAAAITESRAHIATAHRVAAESDELEHLLGAVEDVDEPLGHAFGRAERAFRRLRR